MTCDPLEPDVRTPLTALVSAVAIMRSRLATTEDEDLRSMLDVCEASAAHLSERLAPPPPASLSLPARGEMHDVRDVVRDAVVGASELAQDISVGLGFDEGRRPRWVSVDRRTMAMAIENVLIRLLGTGAGADHVSVNIRPSGRGVRIAFVADLPNEISDFSPESAFQDEGTRAVERLIDTYGGHLTRGEGLCSSFHVRIWLPMIPRPRARNAMCRHRDGRKDPQ